MKGLEVILNGKTTSAALSGEKRVVTLIIEKRNHKTYLWFAGLDLIFYLIVGLTLH